MLDFFRLAIPIIPTHVRSLDNHHWFNGDIRDFGVPAATRHVSKTDDGQTITGELYHPYESLPSDYTDMAMKFYTNTMNAMPYVEIKGSPLKRSWRHTPFRKIKNSFFMYLGMRILELVTISVDL